MTMTRQDKVLLFHGLHSDSRVLVPPNAWDVASACLVDEAGATAIATTSAGIAWSLGPAITLAAYALVRRGARELLATGTYETLAGALDYGELNALLYRPGED